MRDSREAILQAATALLAEGGFAEASLRNVATRAGCTTGSVTHHFADRQELLMATLERAHQAAAARMLEKVSASLKPKAQLRAVIHEALPLDRKRMIEWRVWLAFWNEAAANPAVAREHSKRYREWRAALDALLRPLVASPSSRAHHVDSLVALIDGLGLGLIVASKPAIQKARALDAVERMLSTLR
ncbi:MAG: TetR/AcrR family transcriptional regulator [Archangium sp.]